MSTPILPDEIPKRLSQEALPKIERQIEDAIASLPEPRSTMRLPTLVTPSQSGISGWVTTALQSVTLVTIVACAFWLGQLSTTVSNTSQKLDKLNDGVVGISRDSLSNQLIAIETKLDIIGKTIEAGAAQPRKKPASLTLSHLTASRYPQFPKGDP